MERLARLQPLTTFETLWVKARKEHLSAPLAAANHKKEGSDYATVNFDAASE